MSTNRMERVCIIGDQCNKATGAKCGGDYKAGPNNPNQRADWANLHSQPRIGRNEFYIPSNLPILPLKVD